MHSFIVAFFLCDTLNLTFTELLDVNIQLNNINGLSDVWKLPKMTRAEPPKLDGSGMVHFFPIMGGLFENLQRFI